MPRWSILLFLFFSVGHFLFLLSEDRWQVEVESDEILQNDLGRIARKRWLISLKQKM